MSGSDDEHLPVRSRKRHAPDDDSDDEGDGQPEEKKAFRFNARNAFLTYPNCPILPGEYRATTSFDWNRVKLCFAKQERHTDGHHHLHVYIAFVTKLDHHDPRYFDASYTPHGAAAPVTFHPNIRRNKGKQCLVRIWEYLCKDGGTPPSNIIGAPNLYPVSKNFRKDYGDRLQWLNYLAVQSLDEPRFPMRGPNGEEIKAPAAADKKRHLWIWGPPNAGKTHWLERNVYQFKNYKVAATTYPFDDYTGEPIVVYDDVRPVPEHLLSICNTSDYPRPCPGSQRYYRRIIPGKTVTLVIVATNFNIDDFMQDQPAETTASIKERFREMHVTGAIVLDD